ncbi:hypothetical protein [Rhizobium sp. H4]|uniref:hypothetical protein n=1 Tax=Rhizobium sp. H4 TaxID=2035449 RepID=UPI000D0F8D38|nr:hypothetical protein [Rhizobium sp. H4]
MRKAAIFCAVVLAGVIAYGYVDAAMTEKAVIDIQPRVIEPLSLAFDTMNSMQPFQRGQLFIMLMYDADRSRTITSIHVQGDVMEGDKLIEHFDAPCQRGGNEDLSFPGRTLDGSVVTGTSRQCFIKLKTALPVGKDANGATSMVDIENNEKRVFSMNVINSFYSARSSHPPLTYVVWINRAIDWLRTPFKRATLHPAI